jgi:hypothetical protein
MPDTVRLVYVGKLPRTNRNAVHWSVGYRLKQQALRQFGQLPFRVERKARVQVTRVLGKGERGQDLFENAPWRVKKLIDAAVQAGYLYDDSPAWAVFTYAEDATRRAEGPRVEITLEYEGEHHA